MVFAVFGNHQHLASLEIHIHALRHQDLTNSFSSENAVQDCQYLLLV